MPKSTTLPSITTYWVPLLMVSPVPAVRFTAALLGAAGAEAEPLGRAGEDAGADGVAAVLADAEGEAEPGADGVPAAPVGAELAGFAAVASADGSQAVSSRAEPAVIAETRATAEERRRRARTDMEGSPLERWSVWSRPGSCSALSFGRCRSGDDQSFAAG